MENQISVSRKLKNVREFKNDRGTLMVAQLTQRDEHDRAVFTMPIVIHDTVVQDAVRSLDASRTNEYTVLVTINGQLNTRFDREPNKNMADRKPPFTRIVAQEVLV
jgi:hypothetical protein